MSPDPAKDRRTCPGCGRSVPRTHALCVKCGARLDQAPGRQNPAQHRRRTIAVVVVCASLALVATAVAIGLLRDCGDQKTRPPAASSPPAIRDAGVERPPSPLDAAVAVRPRRPPPDAAVIVPPFPGPIPAPHIMRFGLITQIRECVDRRRIQAEKDCAKTGRVFGQTAEAGCLVSKMAYVYWACLKSQAKKTGLCLARCVTSARGCAWACLNQEPGPKRVPTATCLADCWRKQIDPCIAGCIRP